jgi:omega-6 fatty acid desaturase (delta-12 desaturase)
LEPFRTAKLLQQFGFSTELVVEEITNLSSPLAPSRSTVAAAPSIPHDANRWPKILARYREPSLSRSLVEIAVTAVPMVVLWSAMWFALQFSYWAALTLSLPASAFLVRLFMIQHDCSHDAFFARRTANAWVGRIIGILTLTPFDFWRRTHAIHHSTSGNLDRRGIGDVETLTVAEYKARSRWGRLRYRIYRHPIVMFGLGPAYLFLLQHRVPLGLKGWRPWISTMTTNLGIVMLAGGLIWLIGFGTFLMIHLPIALIASSVGVWLFYVQHQFEHTHWDHDGTWDHPQAALHGSSHYVLPGVLRWFTANIGIHHVHHLCSRVPYYRLPEVLRDFPELAEVGKLTLWQSFGCVRLVLWDETSRRLVSFRALRQGAKATEPATANSRFSRPHSAGGQITDGDISCSQFG